MRRKTGLLLVCARAVSSVQGLHSNSKGCTPSAPRGLTTSGGVRASAGNGRPVRPDSWPPSNRAAPLVRGYRLPSRRPRLLPCSPSDADAATASGGIAARFYSARNKPTGSELSGSGFHTGVAPHPARSYRALHVVLCKSSPANHLSICLCCVVRIVSFVTFMFRSSVAPTSL